MAITEVPEYAHLSDADLDTLAAELEEIRCHIEASRGAKDRAYIMRAIAFQRYFEIGARLMIATTKGKFGWAVGTVALAAAKCIENMELGHNISHGQWDWMNDPEIHSNTWEWDMAGLTSQWRFSHNYRHHVFANVVGVDDDLGFRVMRVTRDQEWWPGALLQPLRAVLLAIAFEWGVAMHGLISVQDEEKSDAGRSAQKSALIRKMARQVGKDYVLFPVLSRRRWLRTLGANVIANGLRNAWAYVVIVCGHFVVRALCVTYDLPYTTGPLLRQYLLTVRTICKLALPDRFLSATSHDAPETASEHRFRNVVHRLQFSGVGDDLRRSGLATALLAHSNRG